MTAFRPQSRYRIFALVSLVMAGLFGWDLLHGVEAGAVLFFVVCLGILIWAVRIMFTKVYLAADRLIVATPLSQQKEVEFRQILSVTEEGRGGKAIVVVYHPRVENGLLDLDRAKTVSLPAVENQDALYEDLVQKAPL